MRQQKPKIQKYVKCISIHMHMIACSLAMHAVWIFQFPQQETRHDLFANYSYQTRYENLLLQSWWLLKEPVVVLF